MKIVWQIRRIFDGIGVEMTTDVFEKIWEQASSRHPAGLVRLNKFSYFHVLLATKTFGIHIITCDPCLSLFHKVDKILLALGSRPP